MELTAGVHGPLANVAAQARNVRIATNERCRSLLHKHTSPTKQPKQNQVKYEPLRCSSRNQKHPVAKLLFVHEPRVVLYWEPSENRLQMRISEYNIHSKT